MANIPALQSRKLFTVALQQNFDELGTDIAPTLLSSFFPKKVYSTMGVSWLARRGNKKIAGDVIRGSKGNLSQATQFTEKQVIPPYYKEGTNVSAMNIYDVPFESGDTTNFAQVKALAENTANELFAIKQTIDMATEKQAADVLTSGIVELNNTDNIDFKRDSSMIEVLTGTDLWDATGVDIIARFETAGAKLRNVGKITGGQKVNAIMGLEAWQAFRKDSSIKDGDNFIVTNTLNIAPRMKSTSGGMFMGSLKAGGFEYDIWVYDETYTDANGDDQLYFDSKMVIFLPESFKGQTSYCQVPELPSWVSQSVGAKSVMGNKPSMSEGFRLYDYVDAEDEAYYAYLKVCPIVQPISIDKIYTVQVLATV